GLAPEPAGVRLPGRLPPLTSPAPQSVTVRKKAVQYIVGNPLFAIQMTRHDLRAGLYAPLRVLLYEAEEGKTCLEYDRPSSLFGQFGNAKGTEVAAMLDRKLEQLVAQAI